MRSRGREGGRLLRMLITNRRDRRINKQAGDNRQEEGGASSISTGFHDWGGFTLNMHFNTVVNYL